MAPETINTVFSGLLGLIIGSIATYVVRSKLERDKVTNKIMHIHSLIFIEIADHQESLHRDIDYLLPYWVLRGERDNSGKVNAYFKMIEQKPSNLNNLYYDRFLNDLVHSKHMIMISDYYNILEILNEGLKTWEDSDLTEGIVHDVMRDMKKLLNFSMNLLADLYDKGKVKKCLTDRHNDVVDRIRDKFIHYRLILDMCKLQRKNLWNLQTGEPDHRVSNLIRYSRNENYWKGILQASDEIIDNYDKNEQI
jgi:hypothetical protein